ncbi:MAG: putative holliday junction resolvase [Chloroflexi bacterium]|nr:MAG: putative holliday junction resolvase [Chloroflexota bacterium]
MAVDPGEKRIGLAISDPTGTIARTLTVIQHTSMGADCTAIAQLAAENEVVQIIVGEALGVEGENTPQTRHAHRMAEMIKQESSLPVDLWDEHGSTRAAKNARITMGVKRRNRRGHLDDLAAVIILQSYLNWKSEKMKENG